MGSVVILVTDETLLKTNFFLHCSSLTFFRLEKGPLRWEEGLENNKWGKKKKSLFSHSRLPFTTQDPLSHSCAKDQPLAVS